MLLKVVEIKIICAYGKFRRGFIRWIMMGFIRGITLEDHPLRPAKMQVTDPVGGSAGIPDSLGHKPEDTSGRGWLASVLSSLSASLSFLPSPFPYPLSFFY
jgi:hypothetical protein